MRSHSQSTEVRNLRAVLLSGVHANHVTGILADMMGLGKTLSILSLIVATINEAETFRLQAPAREMKNIGIKRNARGTLLVCPKSVLSNWSEQIQAHIYPGKLSMITYHGTNRLQDLDELSRYDIVLTTYGTVATEMNDGMKKKVALASLQWFRVVLDEGRYRPDSFFLEALLTLS
jgi:SNF2 family DNA or RNA helicase